jgi:DNA polymerase-3 subunit epsilon
VSTTRQPGLFDEAGDRSLELERALVVFDLETTGVDPSSDRIVEISACRLDPDGSRGWLDHRVNPGMPIPPEATAIHGISDHDVAAAPRFEDLADDIEAFFEGADLGGFNVARFDLPVLDAEFRRVGRDADLTARRVVDVMTIFHRKERRDLGAAVRLYLGREHDGAHAARADVEATVGILEAQVRRYADLPGTVEELDAWCKAPPPGALDHGRRLVWSAGEAVVNFGPHRGRTLREVAADADARGFLRWILGKDFDADVKRIVADALDGKFPEAPAE